MVMVEMLEEEGLTVRAAASPAEARAAAGTAPGCTLLVTDIDLGLMEEDGFDVAAAIRQARPRMPVVFVSGRPWLLDAHPLAPHERKLAKPFRQAELVRAVQELLRDAH